MPGFVVANMADKMVPRSQMLEAILNSHLLLADSGFWLGSSLPPT